MSEKQHDQSYVSAVVEHKRVVIQNRYGEKLVGILHGTGSDELVIICHGFRSSKDRVPMVNLAFAFERDGISAFRFDFAGNGQVIMKIVPYVTGQFVEAEDLRVVVEHFQGQQRFILAVVGHSKGGNAVLLYASRYNDVQTIVNIAGRFNLRRGIEGRLGTDFQEKIEQYGFIDVKNKKGKTEYRVTKESLMDRLATDTRAACQTIPLSCRVLTVHGTVDEFVPVEDAIEFSKYIPNHDLCIVEGADHEYTKHQSELASIVLNFVKTGLHKDESGPKSREAEDLHAVIEHFLREQRLILAVVGHSKGGNAVVNYASRYNDDVQIIVNISGCFNLNRWSKDMLGKDFHEKIEQYGFIDVKNRRGKIQYRVTKEDLMDILGTDTRAACQAIPLNCRVLTVYGSVDEIIPVEDAIQFSEYIFNHNLCIVEGADHEYTKHQSELASIVLNFVKTGLHKDESVPKSLLGHKKVSIENRYGEKLVGILHETESKELVIICHGFRSSKDRNPMVNLAFAFEREGISAFRFDFAGNGKGGSVVINYASRYNDNVQIFVNISGCFNFNRSTEDILGKHLHEKLQQYGFIDVKNRRGKTKYRVTKDT
ncbi:hypothetical protein BUALT_Bualt10G0124900 [Buddleja alternifolia]|uniref:Serine aminopeptidase S33 domain-containing protein n=1 Tax=Buddleja alternifolia TaxID=168488 RepID=A0AAV6WZC2_9LAMI|nr:hypothetical protein BUALT_Bualt10G0124900 [Buddleja alternifolia]